MCFKFHIYLFGRGYPYHSACVDVWMTELSVLSFGDEALVLSFDYKGLSLFESVSQEAPD